MTHDEMGSDITLPSYTLPALLQHTVQQGVLLSRNMCVLLEKGAGVLCPAALMVGCCSHLEQMLALFPSPLLDTPLEASRGACPPPSTPHSPPLALPHTTPPSCTHLNQTFTSSHCRVPGSAWMKGLRSARAPTLARSTTAVPGKARRHGMRRPVVRARNS